MTHMPPLSTAVSDYFAVSLPIFWFVVVTTTNPFASIDSAVSETVCRWNSDEQTGTGTCVRDFSKMPSRVVLRGTRVATIWTLSGPRRLSPQSVEALLPKTAESHPALWHPRLSIIQWLIERLGVAEFRRRLFHMSPAVVATLLPLFPHPDVWRQILIGIVFVLAALGLAFATVYGRSLTRRPEENLVLATWGYAIPIVAPLLLIPGQAELGLMTLQIVAFGDGSATFGGLLLGGRRLPWNRQKTYGGLFCFTIFGSCAATFSYWCEASPGVSFASTWLICSVAAVCAAIVESLPFRSNDNLRVGATALSVGMVMTATLA